MANTMREIMNPCLPAEGQPGFPDAPLDWNEDYAVAKAKMDEMELVDDHWEAIRALQGYFARHGRINSRELNDALEEKFYARGGLKYLYELFPGGPITQGCRFAGIEMAAANIDVS